MPAFDPISSLLSFCPFPLSPNFFFSFSKNSSPSFPYFFFFLEVSWLMGRSSLSKLFFFPLHIHRGISPVLFPVPPLLLPLFFLYLYLVLKSNAVFNVSSVCIYIYMCVCVCVYPRAAVPRLKCVYPYMIKKRKRIESDGMKDPQ
jgi:hypothetical protein